jgi:hypothetical protein
MGLSLVSGAAVEQRTSCTKAIFDCTATLQLVLRNTALVSCTCSCLFLGARLSECALPLAESEGPAQRYRQKTFHLPSTLEAVGHAKHTVFCEACTATLEVHCPVWQAADLVQVLLGAMPAQQLVQLYRATAITCKCVLLTIAARLLSCVAVCHRCNCC